MMKMRNLITITLLLISASLISQSNEANAKTVKQFLHETYFERLYTYEPVLMHRNFISSIKTTMSRYAKGADSTSKLKRQVTFRRDGRTKQLVEWYEYYQSPSITDFKYDGIGNLIEYRRWTSAGYPNGFGKADKEVERIFFQYDKNRLSHVFSYSQRNGQEYLTLNYCDSLSYQLNNSKVSIIRGNGNHEIHRYYLKPHFIYPVNKSYVNEFINDQTELLVELPGQKILKNDECPYSNQILITLQEITGIQCLPKNIVTASKGGLFWSMEPPKDTMEVIFGDTNLQSQDNTIYIDTMGQKIYVKSHFFMSEPTSLENRNTSTFTTQIYDYDLILRETREIRESSRGVREYRKDSSKTSFEYFVFGLPKRKTENHYYFVPANDTGPLDGPEIGYYRSSVYEEVSEVEHWEW